LQGAAIREKTQEEKNCEKGESNAGEPGGGGRREKATSAKKEVLSILPSKHDKKAEEQLDISREELDLNLSRARGIEVEKCPCQKGGPREGKKKLVGTSDTLPLNSKEKEKTGKNDWLSQSSPTL